MGYPNPFAVLQKDMAGLNADQLKRAFNSFSNLTDADAVRLAVGARGILMRQLGHDAARALQAALQSEGVNAVVVPESELPRLPEGRSLHRLQLSAEALTTYDLVGRTTAVPWTDVALVAAAAIQVFESTRTQTERTVLKFNPVTGLWPKKVVDVSRKVESGSALLLEMILAGGNTRLQIDAADFPFKQLIDRPEMSTEQKFVWLVREVCRRATRAVLNAGARSLQEGHDDPPAYVGRQALADEMVWLLWRSGQSRNA